MADTDHLLKHLGIDGYFLKTAIKIGSFFVRPKDIQQHLSRYALRFVSLNDDSVYEAQHLGTAVGIKYRGRFFVVTTNHQRTLGTDGELGVLSGFEAKIVTPKTMWPIRLSEDQERDDRLDFILFELDPASYSVPSLASQFFEVASNNQSTELPDALALCIGFPTRLQIVDYYAGKVELLLASNYIEFIKGESSEDIHAFRTLSEDRFFEDGMSGAPVFDFLQKNGCFTVRWLGIVVRGGPGSRKGRIIDATFLTRQIERAAF